MRCARKAHAGAHRELLVDLMHQLQHVLGTDKSGPKTLARAGVMELFSVGKSVRLQLSLDAFEEVDTGLEVMNDIGLAGLLGDLGRRSLKNLPNIHAPRYTRRIQRDLDRLLVLRMRHLTVRK